MYNDPSNNILFIKKNTLNRQNRKKTSLHSWKDEKYNIIKYTPPILSLNKDNDIEKNLNKNINDFTMKVDDILNNLKKERGDKAIKYHYNNNLLLKIKDSLDNSSKISEKIVNGNISNSIYNINKKYDELFDSFKKNSSFVHRRSSSYAPISDYQAPPKHITINVSINKLEDLIQLCEDYPIKKDTEYNINMKAIHNIREPLELMNNMIGMHRLKLSVLDQLLFYIQDLGKTTENDYMHTVIYGPPGTGKTEIAKIMGKIFSKLGVLKKNIFRKVTRSDLIAGYLGQTAIKTKDVINECLGGVLFIDEAYALGNKEKRDSFSKECIDTLCEALSDNKNNLMVIVAGYEEDLKKCFFDYNKGLQSRFTWRYRTDDYNAEELKLIFEKKIRDIGWQLFKKDEITVSWFEKNKKYFKFFGRDMETLLGKVKIAHSRRVFCKDKDLKTKITIKDLDNGLKMFIENDETQKNKMDDHIMNSLYC